MTSDSAGHMKALSMRETGNRSENEKNNIEENRENTFSFRKKWISRDNFEGESDF